jgi:tetratricopeptide (TPR) repeat protein
VFLARTDEQKRFNLAVEELFIGTNTTEPSPVILVHGSGGMGKSELCERFAEIARGEISGAEGNADQLVVCKVEWQDERDHHSSEYPALTGPQLPVVLSALHHAVIGSREFEDRQGKKEAERAFSSYLRIVSRLSPGGNGDEYETQSGAFDPIISAGAQAAGAAFGVPVPGDALGGVLSGVRARRRREQVDSERIAVEQRPYELLMREFARGLSELSEGKPIVLILDTYELITSCGGWIRQVMSQTGGRVLWVVAGRIENEEDAGRSGEIASFRREVSERSLMVMRISPFDRETVAELLKARGVSALDDQSIDAVVSLTHGVPLAVDIVSSLLREETMDEISRAVTSEGDPTKVVRELTERYLRHAERDDDLKGDIPLLFGLALLYADRADLDLVAALWGEEMEVGATLAELATRHDFVLTGRRRLHQEVRGTFQRYMLGEFERGEYRDSNKRAADLAKSRADAAAAGKTSRELFESKEWRDASAALVWHRFWVDNADGFKLLCEVFPEAVLFERSFAHELVGIASFFGDTFLPEQASLLRGLASLLSFGGFLDGWFAKRREVFHPDQDGIPGGEGTDHDRENALQVLRRFAGRESQARRKDSQVAAVELVIAKASLRTDPDTALAALERAADLILVDDAYLWLDVESLARDLALGLGRPSSGRSPSDSAIRAAELSFHNRTKTPGDWLLLAQVHQWLDRTEAAAGMFGEIVDRFADDPEADRVVSEAMFEHALAFERLGRVDDAVRGFDRFIDRYSASEQLPPQQRRVAAALLNKANLLERDGNTEGCMETYRAVSDAWGETKDPGLRLVVARALSGQAAVLHDAGRTEEAAAALDELIERFDDDHEMKVTVIQALVTKGAILRIENPEEAFKVFGEVIDRYGDDDEVVMRESVARALHGRAHLLAVQGDDLDGGLADYGRVAERYAERREPELRRLVLAALSNSAALLREAGRVEERRQLYSRMIEMFDGNEIEDEQTREAVIWTLTNRSILDSESGGADDLDRAEASLKRAVSLSGGVAYPAGSYALFLLDSRKDRDGARLLFEQAFDADPEEAGAVGNFARLLFEDGEIARAMEMAELALAHATESEDPLRLELHFYVTALGPPERRADALAAVRELLAEGVTSPGWELDGILDRARAEGRNGIAELEGLASEITAH